MDLGLAESLVDMTVHALLLQLLAVPVDGLEQDAHARPQFRQPCRPAVRRRGRPAVVRVCGLVLGHGYQNLFGVTMQNRTKHLTAKARRARGLGSGHRTQLTAVDPSVLASLAPSRFSVLVSGSVRPDQNFPSPIMSGTPFRNESKYRSSSSLRLPL